MMTGNLTHHHDKHEVDINGNIKIFMEDEIEGITNNFSTLIGKGGFGEVYRGTLDNDNEPVAVKRYINEGLREVFMEEVHIHSKISHKNVVKLIGYCIGEHTLMIVMEYMSQGNLNDILHNSEISIPLDVRLGIAIGCAEALSYMHSMHLSSGNLVCHGDIKPANILLDDNLTAKLTDFGVSRLLVGGITRYTTTVKGSIEYMDPIYIQEGCLTPRSDVYSFGLVLCELIARKRVRKGDINLIGHVNKGGASGKGFREIFDAAIANENNMKTLKEMKKLAIECLSLNIYRRPQMADVVKGLRIMRKELRDRHENYSESILASHHSWRRNNRQEIIMPSYNSKLQLKKCLSSFKQSLSNSKIQSEPSNVKIFTQEELKEATHNYSYRLSGGTSGQVYKGTLEDNTVVAVRIFSEVLEGFEEAFINGGMILSQILHRNIIKLLGYCLDADFPAFVYEYAAKGSLSDVLDGHEEFPLYLRVKIAVKVADALEYLHSSTAGIIRHGYVVPSKILLDGNFMPKLTGFSWARKFIKDSNIVASDDVISSHQLPSSGLYNNPIHSHCVLLKVKTDVYQFGVLLLTLISRKNFVLYADHNDLISQFLATYETDRSGRAFFDDNIVDRSEDIVLLEEIGRLSRNCMCEEIDQRPTMKEVAEHLRIITRSWKKCSSEGTTLVEAEEPYSTPYKDVMAWFAMGKQRQKGLGHTCMKQAGHKLLGRDDIRQKVMENILLGRNIGSDCTVICISGGSGFGKTSLLHALYSDQELIDAFDKRIWIQISDKLDILMLFRKIIEFNMNDHCSIMNIDLLRELVMEEIKDKKFLLFLDDADIQDQQCWTSILEVLNAGAKDSAVVMATSSTNDVLRDIATHSYFLNPLPEESNMMILQQYFGVGTDIQNNPDLVMIAKRFISRFGSNPLNLKSICGLLCHADTISLDKDKFEGSVMPLQLCHDVLPSHLKKCLAFCSLFPERYIFDKHHTVRQWISHGCVRTLEGYGLEDVGLEYFSELLCRSFFQPSPIHNDKNHKFVMHELMYKVVESVGCDRYFKSENPVSSVPESILHLSFVASQFQTVKLMSITEELKDLQTFLVVQPQWKAYNISFPTLNLVGLDEFFLKFTSLETLDLSHTDIEELPGSIVGLRNLRYLSVNSTNVRALPSELCSLSNLQTLEAKHCRFLTELPGDIKKLVKLRHLDLTKELGYIHVHLPRGIGELTELQTLPVFHVSGDLSCCSISDLGTLHNLRGCLCLSGLESVKTGSKAQEASLKDKHHLKDLTLQWHDDDIDIEDEDENEDTENVADEQVLESLQPHASLQVLAIRGYEGSRFPAWMQGSSSSLPNLVTLTLDSCCNCTEFPAIAQLPSLKSLSVRKMYYVRRLISNPHGDGAAKFPSLELLNLWEMYGLEDLFFEESEKDCLRLRKVCISRCPDLKRLPRTPVTELVLHCGHQFPDISELTSLVSLKIEGFHGTKSFRLPPAAALRKLEIRSCKELSLVDGLSALTTVRWHKIAGCPKLVLPEPVA